MPTYFDKALAQLEIFEGSIPCMYVDTRSHVTVGVGLMLPDAASASALPFVDSSGNAVTPAAVVAEFKRITALAPGMRPGFYQTPASPRLAQQEITDKLKGVLTGFEAKVRAGIAGYDALPDCVKMALLDMAYNLGPDGLLKGYPSLFRAIATANWAQAAIQCARGGIGATRNAWTRQQFLSAAAGLTTPPASGQAGAPPA